MEQLKSIYMEKIESVATIYFNRPDKRNALTLEMWRLLQKLLKEVEDDDRIRVLILRGVNETAYSSGADISEFKSLRSTAEGAKRYRKATLRAEQMLARLSKPTISLIQGYCVGGGCELAVASDFRFSDTTGRFGITPSKLGFIYHFTGTKHLVELVGSSKAKDILFSGRILKAEEALAIGLIDRLYLPEEIAEKTYEYATLLSRNAQTTIRGAKRIIHEILDGSYEENEALTELILSSYVGSDYKEGVEAFIQKREPKF